MLNQEKSKKLNFINSPLFLLIIGFLLTTLGGTYVSHSFNEDAWKSKAKFEIFKEQLKESMLIQDSILSSSNKRIYQLRLIRSELSKNNLESAQVMWEHYLLIVKKWNINIISNQYKIEFLFGKDISLLFLDNKENNVKNPKSLHHMMRKTHRSISAILKCKKNMCKKIKEDILFIDASNNLNSLGLINDEFSIQLHKKLNHNSKKLFLD